ncbi:MAG: DNA polymerase III subunit alpha, partial [Clostridia bacterium]|nr:DNA polymerase III subunit alpha [Clostridia bacterium]
PLIGMEAYVAPRSRFEKEAAAREYAHLILICKNEVGYKNLMYLSSEGFISGFYYRPRIDYELLAEHSKGLICTSACLAGDIPQYLLHGQDEKARELAKRLQDIFGEDFYIELQNHGLPEQMEILPKLDALAKELGIKTVGTNDIHYVKREDAEAQDVLLCIQTNRYVDEEDRMKMSADEFYLKSEDEMREMLYAYQDSIDNTKEVADKCDLTIKFGERHLPGFTAPDGLTNAEYLKKLCEEGFARKMPNGGEDAKARLAYELGVIESMGFVDYFLIVWDFIHFAKTHGIMVGPGRGSGAGSLAAYCLDITDVDPLKYDLLFERFLNPERISMPDFDIDFCYERRQEVIDYVVEKYGKDHVTQIITFGTMAAKGVIRDVGRTLRIPYGDVDRIAKMVPNVLNITLKEAMEMSFELREKYQSDSTVQKLIDLALKLEGLPRHASTHAAGVVISAAPVVQFVPLQKNDEAITTQFPMGTLEELGLLKMDFLGLRTLTVIRDALTYIRQGGGEAPDFSRMEYDDPKVYSMISRGDTDGVFQLESSGMRQFMSQLRPDCFEDIIAGISLFRPGPMDQIPRYVAGKNDKNKIQYTDEKLRPILSTTYGCMVYQEQVMQIVRDLAGYSLGRSDLVRRAMAKKKQEVMAKEREYFIHGIVEDGKIVVPGAVRNGVSEAAANRIFDEMMDFASYAFNKSHAACYAVLAYQTGWLKHYYPTEFMCALINSFMGNSDKISEYIYSCGKHGIRMLPPDINRSLPRFSVEEGNIRFGLAGVRNVGEAAMRDIIAEREKNGSFKDFHDFLRRAPGLNKRLVEGLIKSGCFDGMNVKRSQLMAIYERAMDAAASDRRKREEGQLSLFDAVMPIAQSLNVPLPNIPEFPQEELLSMEREVIGIYLSGHPLMAYSDIIDALGMTVSDLVGETPAVADGSKVKLAGVVTSIRTKPTKSGSGLMGYGMLEDLTGSMEIVAFPSVMQKFTGLLRADAQLLICGRLSTREDQENSILIDDVMLLEDVEVSKKAYLKIPYGEGAKRSAVVEIMRRFPGSIPVVLYDETTKKKSAAPKELYINDSDALLSDLTALLGGGNVKIINTVHPKV